MSFQDFQKKPGRMAPRELALLFLAIVIVLLILVALGATNYYLAGLLPGGGEFSLLRTGGRSYLFDRIEPYSGTVPALVQEQVYGRAALTGENAYILDIPFHLMILFFPLALFPDALVARAFWMALTQIAFFALIFLGVRLLPRRLPKFLIVLLYAAGFSSLYAYLSFLDGSPVILLGVLFLGTLLSLRAGLDELAGILIVLSGFQWELGGPFLFFIVLWVFWQRRWRVFFGAAMLGFVLVVITLFLYPAWVIPFWRAAWNSFRLGFGYSAHDILASLWPQYGRTLGSVLAAVLVVSLGYEWRAAWDASFQRVVWAAYLTIAATPLLGQRVQMDQLALLVLPIIMIVVVSRERWHKRGNVIAILLLLFFTGIPWLLQVRGAPDGIGLSADELLFLFWPVFTTLGLYWLRWWIIRPPRTWVDYHSQEQR